MKGDSLAVTLAEYSRIFQTIHSVSSKLDNRPGASCLFYNSVGAFLLEQSLGTPARPRMGAAFIRVDDATDTVLSFAEAQEDGSWRASRKGFHCWVETEYHIIDFTAPIYRQYFEQLGSNIKIPRKMFQRSKAHMATSHLDLRKEGDYFLQPDLALTFELSQESTRNPAIGDLANACFQWFTRPPKKMRKALTMMSDRGELVEVELSNLSIIGAW